MSTLAEPNKGSTPSHSRDASAPRRRPSCFRLAFVDSRTGQSQGEMESLLRGRLQVASLIILIPSLFFLVGNVVGLTMWQQSPPTRMIHSSVTALTLAFVLLLWSKVHLSRAQLRLCELTLFGMMALFFAWMQFEDFYRDRFHEIVRPGNENQFLRMMGMAITIRWFFLIIIYGVFIPNTWQRCALIVSGAAMLPLLLTVLASYLHGRLDAGVGYVLVNMAILLLTAVAVAIFGSHRIHVLREQALEAQQLGQYRLKKRLGRGGMGEVFLAEHSLLRRPCAIKLIRPQDAGDPTTLERFEREVHSMARLTHWNTVEIFDFGHGEDGTFYYVMEYLPGETLEKMVERTGPMPAARAIHFLRQVCYALREAHAAGMLHRDVKPSNILVCERGGVHDVAKLLDFGLVQCMKLGPAPDKLTVQGTIVGSPPYMSPEQALVRPLDARSDVYGLGAVAYYLLTGQPPFPRDTAMAMLLAHAYEPVVPPAQLRPDVPLDLQEIVLRCLAKKPEDRFPSADSLERALAACRDANGWTEADAAAAWHNRPAEADGETTTEPLKPLPATAAYPQAAV
jgi:eukaryotic-like serine/threonine-protein kinase